MGFTVGIVVVGRDRTGSYDDICARCGIVYAAFAAPFTCSAPPLLRAIGGS